MSLPSGCVWCHVFEMRRMDPKPLWGGVIICSHCGTNDPAGWRGLCQTCLQALDQHRTQGDWPIVSHLFTYQDKVRELIVKTKARGGNPEFKGCLGVFLDDPRSADAAEWCDAVVAAPPSFWTRIRGRPHLATEMARTMARRHNKMFVRVVPPVFWRFKKQSMKSGQSRVEERKVQFRLLLPRKFKRRRDGEDSARPFRVLLIDDVRTTGQTLYSIFGAISEAVPEANVRTLVFAAADGRLDGSRARAESRTLSQTR